MRTAMRIVLNPACFELCIRNRAVMGNHLDDIQVMSGSDEGVRSGGPDTSKWGSGQGVTDVRQTNKLRSNP
jgi:hypothetical protein